MKRKYFIAGNHRVGDTLGHAKFFINPPPEGVRNFVVANQYNGDMYKFLMRRTKLHIHGLKVMPDSESLMSMIDYEAYIKKIPKDVTEDGEIVPLPPDDGVTPLLPLLPNIRVKHDNEKAYMTLQVDSVASWKSIKALFYAKLPLPSVCIMLEGQRARGDVLVKNNSPEQVANVMLDAAMHIGICSSMTRFASMLGLPTIMCHFDRKSTESQGVVKPHLNPYNVDLFTPDEKQIEEAFEYVLSHLRESFTWRANMWGTDA